MASLLDTFQSFRTILCVCPKCGGLHRLSDLRLRYKGRTPLTWLDSFEAKMQALDEKTQKFEEKEQMLRDEAAARGSRKLQSVICKAMEPCLSRLKLNPYDIKLVTHPIDFVVFDGLKDEKLDDVMFLSKKTINAQLNAVRREVRKAVENGAYDWKVARVDIDGEITYE